MNHRYAAQTEQHQIADPDASMQIHGLLTVVPPTGMKPLFHDKAGEVFQCSAQQKGDGEGRADCRFKGREPLNNQRNQHGSAAVDGTNRAGIESTVDKAVELDVFEHNLHAPAQE